MKKNILIVGTGTIGEPLIGLFSDFKDELDVDIYFHKRTPLIDEVAKVNSLISRGAKLVVDSEKVEAFKELGHKPILEYDAALQASDVIIDCTPAGNLAKERHYLPLLDKKNSTFINKKRAFIAQGSEKDFGLPYAYGINDEALLRIAPNFVQVVSCNTHNICSLLKSLSPNLDNIIESDFVCIRRANDISQNGSFIASPEVGKHDDSTYGTHHAQDASRVLQTMYYYLKIYSSTMKINSQYMHTIRFNIILRGSHNKESVIDLFKENPFIALTHKNLANKVFSFGRDHGYYGRLFNHTVISIPSLNTTNLGGVTKITGFCFTPQDGNSLLSSVAASLYGLYGKKYSSKMKIFSKYLFKEI